jgi:hypothetical protein
MAIPAEHKKDLARYLRIHERLLRLPQEREDRLHEAVLHLGRDPRVLATLDEFSENPARLKEAARNPRFFIEQREIYVPPEVGIVFRQKGQDDTRTWFAGLHTASDKLFGYEGGEGGRGWVCGDPAEPEDGENGGENGGGGGRSPA